MSKRQILKISESELREFVKKSINEVLEIYRLYENTSPKKVFKEVKYFSSNGKTMPNGIGYQRGNFLHECKVNSEQFILDESIHGEQYGLSDYRGGIIVFSTDVNAVSLDKNKIYNKVKQILTTLNQRKNTSSITHKIINKFNKYNDEYIGAYSIGNSFEGKYVGDNGEEYNERSVTIEINGLSSEGLLKLAEMIARIFHQETVLVKDLNTNKIYLANGLRSKEPADFSTINSKL